MSANDSRTAIAKGLVATTVAQIDKAGVDDPVKRRRAGVALADLAGDLEKLSQARETECAACGRESCDGTCAPARHFERLDEGRYRLNVGLFGITLEVDRLRREHGELQAELTVRCEMPGAKTVDGTLSAGSFNLSGLRARQERANYLQGRAQAPEIDWAGLLEELALRVTAAEREGQPAVLLRDLPRPVPDEALVVEGLPLLARHPTILFGDGGAAKSYLALALAGRLEQTGKRVLIADWELDGADHRDRLERLFGPTMPAVRYVRCTRPLVAEADRLRRIVRDERIDFIILDSVAFACDGPPEAAEVAGRYFQAVRQLGPVGSLHVAHVSKAENADQKPFGSAFWHNGARSTWFVQRAEGLPDSSVVTVALYNRKANLGPLRPAIGFEIDFDKETTSFRPVNPADSPDLAVKLSVRVRMYSLLRKGSMSPAAIADELGAQVETVKRTARRYSKEFTTLSPSGDLALLERFS